MKSWLLASVALLPASALAAELKFSSFGWFELEGTAFAQSANPVFDTDGALQQADQGGVSFAIRPSFRLETANKGVQLTLTPFVRVDSMDSQRSHADLREAKLDAQLGKIGSVRFDATLGFEQVFWGKAESINLVNVINAADLVEDLSGDEKLGQPLLRLGAYTGDYGALQLYYLPYVRTTDYAGAGGRFRSRIALKDEPVIETAGERWTPSFAARWSQALGGLDLGLSAFHGVGRDAFAQIVAFAGTEPAVAQPVLTRETRLGIDAQYTHEATLFKFEGVWRKTDTPRAMVWRDGYRDVALVGGIEHTLHAVGGTEADLGLIAEYAWDERGDEAPGLFDRELILGARLAFNDPDDSSLLFLAAVDTNNGEQVLRLEAETRLEQGFRLKLIGGAFMGSKAGSVMHDLRRDNFLQAKLSWWW